MCAQINGNECPPAPISVRTEKPAIALSRSLRSLLWIGALSAGALTVLDSHSASAKTPPQASSIGGTTIISSANTTAFSISATPIQVFSSLEQPSNQELSEFGQGIVKTEALEQTFLDQRSSSTFSKAVFGAPPETTGARVSVTKNSAIDLVAQANMGQSAQNSDSTNAQVDSNPAPKSSVEIRRTGSEILGKPSVQLQGVYVLQGDESSARARVNALYPVSPTALFGAVVDLTTGDGFSDSPGPGLRLNELYFAYAPFEKLPGMRFVVGLMDLTSYFDRNSFAKDGASHFFNRAFQTNPALSAAGLSSRPGLLMNWSVTDNFEIKAAGFSSRRNLGRLALDSFAAEAGVRTGNFIVRGTFVTSRDSDQDTGFEEIFSIPRGRGRFGVLDDDRENAFGINAEYFIPSIKLGFFGRYGWYNNVSLGEGATIFSFGATRLDLFMRNDRLGIAYGTQLTNSDLRRDRGDKFPDVLEVYYDFPVAKFLRLGVTFQERNQFSETIFGFRVKTEFNVLGRLFE